ncbi:MAG TPA: EamA family transporter [Lachnospiraceae bacterium]|nr:EamA family transporter [Lachnospiraceae bacterium]HAP72423.1 EamA family transporter [Lachnospiraceae bacterium]
MSGSKNRQYTLAILFVILDSVGFSLMNFFVKLSGDLPAMQKAFFRNAIALIVSIIVLAGTREKFRIKRESWPWLILRSVFGSLGIFCNFWALSRLTIADASILNKMSPFFAIIMSIFILHELPGVFEWFCVAAAFAGTLFVVKPTAGLASIPAAIGLAGGFFAGTAYTFVRLLGRKGERGPVIVMFFSAFSCLAFLPSLLFHYHPMTAAQVLSLLGAGISASLGQLCVTKAYSLAPAKEISVFDYSQVLFAAICGFLFLGEIPDMFSRIGYVIIIGTALVKWGHSMRTEKS